MRVVEKTTKSAREFVENADFLQGQENHTKKIREIFKKCLTYAPCRVIITKQMKQNSPFSPCRRRRAAVDTFPLGVFWRAECLLRAIFYFAGQCPGIGGTLLLATQKIC